MGRSVSVEPPCSSLWFDHRGVLATLGDLDTVDLALRWAFR